MAFVRIKKLKGKEYAYLVENEWTINGSRQKVKAYLGRVVKPLREKEKITDIQDLDYKDAVIALVKQELVNHGFSEDLKYDCVTVDLVEQKILNGKRNAVIALNEGFLCSQTLKDALEIQPTGHEEKAGIQLAKALLESGLRLPKDTFVQLFEKIYK
ncbi:hypothetical protein GF343_03495 [Candidatus Woesearchaeota archaeon]|nr:hypothetical protein [Candidatus Woesearchaeota archaeon]